MNLIAGSCSIESEKQFEDTIIALLSNGINNIRGGVWKPRTTPNSFEGLGKDAIAIVKKLQKKYDFTFYTEVSNVEQLNLIRDIKCGLWIGARSSSDPFTIEKLSKEIKPNEFSFVGLKNPIGQDIKLWEGSYNRLMDKGLIVTPIFRGFSGGQTIYRNYPNWELLNQFVINTKINKKNLFIDPSHIGGKKDLLKQIIDYSLYLGYENFMIETHPEPEKAITDKEQQITPHELVGLFQSKNAPIKYIRDEFDNIDNEIIGLLKKRKELSNHIGLIKKKFDIQTIDEKRKNDKIKSWGEFSEVYIQIHRLSVNYQNKQTENVTKRVKR